MRVRTLVCAVLVGMAAAEAKPTSPLQTECVSSGYRLYPGDEIEVLCGLTTDTLEAYRLRIGDKLLIRFPSLPDYSHEQPVKPDGTINMPRIGSVKVLGLTLDEAHKEFARQYEAANWRPEFLLVLTGYENDLAEVQRFFTGTQYQVRRVAVVGPDGLVRFPLIEPFAAAGKTFDEVSTEARRRYAQRFPRMTFEFMLGKSTGARAFIYGAVQRPGAYDVSLTYSLPELIALAGGPRSLARLRNVVVARVVNGEVQCRKVNYRKVARGKALPSDVLLCPGEIVFVPDSRMLSMASIMQALGNVLLFRGWGVGLNWSWYDSKQQESQ